MSTYDIQITNDLELVGVSGNEFHGRVDEMRVSFVLRNASWVNATYHTINQTTGFITFGNEELTNHPPIANFTYTPTNPIQTDIIQFTDTSIDPDGNITTWLWDFGDGNTSTLQNPTHLYGDWGNYNVTLNVTDNLGKTGHTSQQINVLNLAPTANFTYSPPNPTKNETIYFTDTSTDLDGIIVSWLWNFDDGYSSSLQNPTHAYSIDGTYNVTLTVMDDDGTNDTIQQNIVVTAQPNNPPDEPMITGETNGKAGTEYEYTFVTTDPEDSDVNYYIEWGDGNYEDWFGPFNSSDPQSMSHTWQKKDIYTIRCKAKDIYGEESVWGTLEVSMPMSKSFNFNFNLLSWLFERFPNAFPILRHVLGL